MLKCLGTLSLVAALTGPSPQAPEGGPAGIPHYTRRGPGLACAGQPTPGALKRLKGLGFRTVINLRNPGEPGTPGEAEAIESQGLRYVSVPVSPDSFSSRDVDAVAAVLGDPAAGPVLLHCGSSNRVGGVMAVLAWRDGRSAEDAIEQGRAAGLHSASMVGAVQRVIADESRHRRTH